MSFLQSCALGGRGGEEGDRAPHASWQQPPPSAPLILVCEFRQLRLLASRGVAFPHPAVHPVVLGGYADREALQRQFPDLPPDVFVTLPVKAAALLERLQKADAWVRARAAAHLARLCFSFF